MRLSTPLFVAIVFFGEPAAWAQTTFTELALSDSSLHDSPATDFWINSSAPADADLDGDLDLLILGIHVTHATDSTAALIEDRLTLYRNDGPLGDSAWALTPLPAPIGNLQGTRADLAWGDYDSDGDLDVVLCVQGEGGWYQGAMALYRNDGGVLIRTTTVLPDYFESNGAQQVDRRSITWADADNDGDLDLLIPSVFAFVDGHYEYVPTALLRNDGPGQGNAWRFTDVGAAFPPTHEATTAWGDMDTDGDLDLLLADFAEELSFARTYRNDGGVFTEAGLPLPHVSEGTVDWGDADGDGDLDVLAAGLLHDDSTGLGEQAVRIYRNEGTHYEPVLVQQTGGGSWTGFTAATWADYDSDGDVDILVAGGVEVGLDSVGVARVYANEGGTFVLAAELPAPDIGWAVGTFAWYDVDGDGDLDYFVSGGYEENGGPRYVARAQLFRNDAVAMNHPPAPPNDLVAVPTENSVTLSWGAADDDHTPAAALTYNLWVRLAPGSDIVSPQSQPDGSGTRLLPEAGNVSHNTTWTLRDLPEGEYEWTVQAIDNAFNGGAFAPTGTFTIGMVTTGEDGTPPARFALLSPVPNPSGEVAVVRFDLPEAAAVALRVFDLLGREVLALPARPVGAGAARSLAVDVASLPAGSYLYRVEAARGGTTEHRTGQLTVAR